MEVPSQIRLTRCSSNQEELALVERLSRENAKNLIAAAWWTSLGQTLNDASDEPDWHWDWRQLVSIHQNKPFFRAVCARTGDGAVQAAMLFRVDALSALEKGERAVFIDRLATAPRNRDKFVKIPVFRGAGSGLLMYAIAVSYSLGFSGRLNLFPIAREQFYLNRGFIRTDINQDNETLFELPATAALLALHQRGLFDG